MKTKFVYVAISDIEDCYFEQVWASAWTLKYHNVNSYVVLLTDEITRKTLDTNGRKESTVLFDEIISVEFDDIYNNIEKSRWIKTKLRQLISGDFVFIDADTFITGDLSEIDDIECSIGAVLDYHTKLHNIYDFPIVRERYDVRLRIAYGCGCPKDTNIFNSGVLLVRDNDKAHEFFKLWHENWLISKSKGFVVDQLPLVRTCIQLNNPITEISGIYNCQIRSSIQYFHKAKIVHTFASQSDNDLSVILGDTIYKRIKTSKCISNDLVPLLLNCKETFTSPSIVVGKKWLKIRFEPSYILLDKLVGNNHLLCRSLLLILNFLSRIFIFVMRQLKI